MAKRRKKGKKPNLPQETLERVRRGTGEGEQNAESGEEESESTAEASEETSESEATASRREARETRRRQRSSGGTAASARTGSGSRSGRSSGGPSVTRRNQGEEELTSDVIREALANPTTFVDEAQLSQEYSYVVRDIRNMLALAVFLMVLLVILAQFI